MTEVSVLDRFLEHARERGLELYPAQEEAILELYSGKNVVLNTPTGSGKSLVATALHFESLHSGRRSVYTCPIKALVNEKFRALCADFGASQVGMVTGDGAVNAHAPILCCTAEILANQALREGDSLAVDDVIMDEFHYYSDRERGVAWQVPLLILRRARFLLMSATLGDTEFFEKELTRLTGRETALVRSATRPVPLEFRYEEIPLHETLAKLVAGGRAPIYLVSFTQAACAEEAQNLLSTDFCPKDQKKAIGDALEGVSFKSPYGKELQRVLRHGIGIHHAGLLPRYRSLVEKLAQRCLLKVICGTDTLGVGVNVPIRTVLLSRLCKFDGEKTAILSARDFHQISGRAGRKGFDELGTVVAQAPEHVVENLRNEQKAAGDPKRLKKLVKRKPPEKGYVHWSRETFDRLVRSEPERLLSRFQVSHGMLLQVLSRGPSGKGDGCQAMRGLLRDCHESPAVKPRLRRTAFQLFRSLVERGIVELRPLRLRVDLQEDFSLHQALSLYLLDALALLDTSHPDYALDVLSLVEAILEDPELILRRQLDRLKREKMAELKLAGVEFDERVAELEKLEYPKPRRELIYETFNAFAAAHPWVGQDNIRPKSIAREMYELFMSFAEYVREYELQRAEGLLLRYLSEVYKALSKTVPDPLKNDEIRAMEDYFGAMIRGVDSSLIDEWEKSRRAEPATLMMMGRGSAEVPEAMSSEAEAPRSPRQLVIAVRNEVFRFVRALSNRRYDEALDDVDFEGTPETLEDRMKLYHSDHGRILTDTRARAPSHTVIDSSDARTWKVAQILVDPDGHNDWQAELELDVEAAWESAREGGHPRLKLLAVGPIGG